MLRLLMVLFALSVPVREASAEEIVELELVLALDVSASVNDSEYALQIFGSAVAFLDYKIEEAIEASPGGIAVTVVQWASENHQKVGMPWTLLRSRYDSRAFAERLSVMARKLPGGNTMIHGGLAFAAEQFDKSPYTSRRQIIDIAGNGEADKHDEAVKERDRLVELGITINGLAIEEDPGNMTLYFRDFIIGGPGAFVETANDFQDVSRAMQRKLLREIKIPAIGSLPLTEPTPGRG